MSNKQLPIEGKDREIELGVICIHLEVDPKTADDATRWEAYQWQKGEEQERSPEKWRLWLCGSKSRIYKKRQTEDSESESIIGQNIKCGVMRIDSGKGLSGWLLYIKVATQ